MDFGESQSERPRALGKESNKGGLVEVVELDVDATFAAPALCSTLVKAFA